MYTFVKLVQFIIDILQAAECSLSPSLFPPSRIDCTKKRRRSGHMRRGSPMKIFLLRRRYLLLGAALALAAAMLFAACLPELLMG